MYVLENVNCEKVDNNIYEVVVVFVESEFKVKFERLKLFFGKFGKGKKKFVLLEIDVYKSYSNVFL